MPRVDIRTLTDPLLFRLHLVAREMLARGERSGANELGPDGQGYFR